jgi:hypothetical protein
MTTRRLSLLVLAALAVLIAGLGAYWFHAAGQLRKGLDEWAAAIRASGGLVEWDEAAVSGFPLRISLRLSAPRLATAALSWQADELSVETALFDPLRITIRAPGSHHVATQAGDVDLRAAGLTGLIHLDLDGRLADLTLIGERLSGDVGRVGAMAAEHLTLTIDPLPIVAADHQTPTATLALAVRDLDLPQTLPLLFGHRVSALDLAVTVKGVLLPGNPTRSLRAWAGEGGVAEITRLALDWQQVSLEAEGTVALDPAGQPLAALAARVRGLPLLMERLAETGLVDAGAANALKFVLMMMSKPDAQGRPAIAVPVSVQDGTVYLGPARLTQFPPIIWPEE